MSKKKPDWTDYETEKAKLKEQNLDPETYYAELRKIIDRLGL